MKQVFNLSHLTSEQHKKIVKVIGEDVFIKKMNQNYEDVVLNKISVEEWTKASLNLYS